MTDFNNSIITKRRLGTSEDPFVSLSEAHTIENSVVQLSEIPDQFTKVTVTGQSITWAEQVSGLPTANTYVVDYNINLVTFHSSREGMQLQFDFKGTGLHFIPIDMIYTNASDGVVITTMRDVVVANSESSTVLSNLNASIATGGTINTTLNLSISNAVSTKNSLDNSNGIATTTKSELDAKNSEALVTKTDLTNVNVTATNSKNDLTTLIENNQYSIESENTRISNEQDRVTAEGNRVIEYQAMINSSKMILKNPVDSYSNIATTYPSPVIYWTVRTIDDGKLYRYDGSAWVWIDTLNTGVYDTLLTETTSQLADTFGLKTYAKNVTRDEAYWDRDPSLLIYSSWADRIMVMLGDSHGWGEGASNYQGMSAGFGYHMPWIHNKSFYGRLLDYMYKKYDSEPWRCIPSYGKGTPLGLLGTGGTIRNGAYISKDAVVKDTATFTSRPRIIQGKYYVCEVLKSILATVSQDRIAMFCDKKTREDSYSEVYKYNAEIGLFGSAELVFAPDASAKSCVLFDIPTPTRYAVVHFHTGTTLGAKCRVELLDNTDVKDDGTENYEQVSTGFGNPLYGTETPTVSIYSTPSFDAALAVPVNVTVTSSYIEFDTSYTGMNNELHYIIDFKQKKMGTLRMSHAGAGSNYSNAGSLLGGPVVITRGVLFGNRDLFKNWSMGSHSTGALLGLETSYQGETRDHITDIKKYMTGSIKALFIQAPVVNEWLKQTSIADFKTRLTAIKTNLNCGNVVVFTTLGTQAGEYGIDTGIIKFAEYFQAVEEWTVAQGSEVTFVDCRKYLKNLVSAGIISYTDLWFNNGHPSPLSHEAIFDMLKRVVDSKF